MFFRFHANRGNENFARVPSRDVCGCKTCFDRSESHRIGRSDSCTERLAAITIQARGYIHSQNRAILRIYTFYQSLILIAELSFQSRAEDTINQHISIGGKSFHLAGDIRLIQLQLFNWLA